MKIYHDNVSKYAEKSEVLAKVLSNLSLWRVIFFIAAFALIVFLANERILLGLIVTAIVCVAGFVYLVKRYNRTDYKYKHTKFLKEINEQEIQRLENKLAEFESGKDFIKRAHPYIADIDTFGTHSLFQLLNRTTTESGSLLLAEWLLAPASKSIIEERQEAVKELAPRLDWRQDFEAAGMHFKNAKSDVNHLLNWLRKPVHLLENQTKYLLIEGVLAICSSIALVYFLAQFISFGYSKPAIIAMLILGVFVAINQVIINRVRKNADEIAKDNDKHLKTLGGYKELIVKIENEQFNSGLLQKLKSVFRQDKYSAADEIGKLVNILEFFQHRGVSKESMGKNAFYGLINIFWLIDIYLIIQAEKWKVKNSAYLKKWADAVSEFEALNSLAGFHYSNPEYAFPEIAAEPYQIHFEELGHPLLNKDKRVTNTFHLDKRGEIAMITGSNMAGKSTFLRTLGINMVLAFTGAPCCAKSARVSLLQLFTSMRTQDNLEEGVSSFYAELKRIEQLLELITSGKPIFFLLDEMFKGTNSKDRYKGGVSLIKQLSELNAFGIISTHDLELAKLAGKHMMVANYSFNSEIKDGEMLFNYKITDGICKDFNASELMRRSGINILPEIEEL